MQILHVKIRILQDFIAGNDDIVFEKRTRLFTFLGLLPQLGIPLIVTWLTWKCRLHFCQLANELRNLNCQQQHSTKDQKHSLLTFKPLFISCLLSVSPIIVTAVSYITHELLYENIWVSIGESILKMYMDGPMYHSMIYYPLKIIFVTFMFLSQTLNSMFETYGVLLLHCILFFVKKFQEQLQHSKNINEVIIKW